MKKLLTLSTLALAAWLAAGVGWATAARMTGLPGPTLAARTSTQAVADALEAVHVPPPLDRARRQATRQLRLWGRTTERLYSVPERIADRLVERVGGAADRVEVEIWAVPNPPRTLVPLARG